MKVEDFPLPPRVWPEQFTVSRVPQAMTRVQALGMAQVCQEAEQYLWDGRGKPDDRSLALCFALMDVEHSEPTRRTAATMLRQLIQHRLTYSPSGQTRLSNCGSFRMWAQVFHDPWEPEQPHTTMQALRLRWLRDLRDELLAWQEPLAQEGAPR